MFSKSFADRLDPVVFAGSLLPEESLIRLGLVCFGGGNSIRRPVGIAGQTGTGFAMLVASILKMPEENGANSGKEFSETFVEQFTVFVCVRH
jgi:hypothetical protein